MYLIKKHQNISRLTQNMHHVSSRKKKVHQRILPAKQKSCFNTRAEAPTLFRFSKTPEEDLSLWITNALSANLIISGDILREKAKFFAQQFEITRFSASNGWVDKFKKRHNLKEYVKWGEANSAPLETLDEERNKLREIIKNYNLNDVFNCDETGKPNIFLKKF